jgi:hypothetical protein
MSYRCPCAGPAPIVQNDHRVGEPLEAAVGLRLAEGFMWMHENRLPDGFALHAYKHIHTRRYLYLTEDGRAFEYSPCGTNVPLRMDFAIQAALCSSPGGRPRTWKPSATPFAGRSSDPPVWADDGRTDDRSARRQAMTGGWLATRRAGSVRPWLPRTVFES